MQLPIGLYADFTEQNPEIRVNEIDSKLRFQNDIVPEAWNYGDQEDDILKKAYEDSWSEWNEKTAMLLSVKNRGDVYDLKVLADEYRYVSTVRKFSRSSRSLGAINYVRNKINPLAVGGVLQSREGDMFVFVRGGTVDNPGMLEAAPAGGIKIDASTGKLESLHRALMRESEEEVGIVEAEYTDVKPTCLVKGFRYDNNSQVCYSMRSGLASTEIAKRVRVASTRNGGQATFGGLIADDERHLLGHLETYIDEMVDNSVASLLFKGKMDYGSKWYEDALDRLSDKLVVSKLRLKPLE